MRRVLVALALLTPIAPILAAAPAGAAVIQGVTATPSVVAPGEQLTISGPAIGIECFSATITVRSGSNPEYRFGNSVNMQNPWSVTASEFRLLGNPVTYPFGTYMVGIDCFDNFGTQTIHQTTATFTVAPLDPTTYRGLTPARLLDTRPGQSTVDGIGAGGGPIGPGSVRAVRVTGRGGVPASGVKAVVLNITATGPTNPGFLTVYPTGASRPLASNLNFGPGETVPNLVVSGVGTDGQVTIYNATGSTHVIADVAGWFPGEATFTPLTPARLLDTRPGQTTIDGVAAGQGAAGPASVRALPVTGRGGVPASGVGAVILNVTAVGPTTAGFVTAYPADEARPLASNLNFAANETRANLVIAKVSPTGQVSIYNDSGSTHLIADVAGWFER